MFCEKCGRMLDEDDAVCPLCGTPVAKRENSAAAEHVYTVPVTDRTEKTEYKSEENLNDNNEPYTEQVFYEDEAKKGTENIEKTSKSRLTAGFLQIFLGGLGIGRFYMGNYGIGVMQLAASFMTCGVGGFIWGVADGVRILRGYPEKDAFGNVLK